jgi:carboxymethylenebutenolidase
VSLDLDAAVDCYGAFVVGTPPEGVAWKVKPLVHLTGRLSCPLLGLFGAEDSHPSPDHVAELERALAENGKEYQFHSYEGAGHAFFAVDRPSYRPQAATDGWQKILAFCGRHLGNSGRAHVHL